jgi:uncharacterized damage-inducible protein DinB
MRRILLTLIAMVCLAWSTFAQDNMPASLLAHLKTSHAFTVKVAEQMPEGDYGFKVNSKQMTYAELIIHIAKSLYFYYGALAGAQPMDYEPAAKTKAGIILFLNNAFNYAEGVLSKETAAQLSKQYSAEGVRMSGWDLVMQASDHTTHHRAQMEVYLRAKDIAPTEYTF